MRQKQAKSDFFYVSIDPGNLWNTRDLQNIFWQASTGSLLEMYQAEFFIFCFCIQLDCCQTAVLNDNNLIKFICFVIVLLYRRRIPLIYRHVNRWRHPLFLLFLTMLTWFVYMRRLIKYFWWSHYSINLETFILIRRDKDEKIWVLCLLTLFISRDVIREKMRENKAIR